jgi:hypothetical protein
MRAGWLADKAKLGALRDYSDAPKKRTRVSKVTLKAGVSEQKKTSGHPGRTHKERADVITKLNP